VGVRVELALLVSLMRMALQAQHPVALVAALVGMALGRKLVAMVQLAK
jgi:hypothetical protein